MREEIERFVASLAIPADRKEVVLAELLDHVACASDEAAARAALGDLEALRRSLEAVEQAFRVTRWHALGRGILAGVLVAILVDRLGSVALGGVAALGALAIAAVLAPPRVLELLRAELRVPRIPVGPALTYAFTVVSVPFLVWIGMIVERGLVGGVTRVHIPWSAFALMGAVYLVLLVEWIRARVRPAVA